METRIAYAVRKKIEGQWYWLELLGECSGDFTRYADTPFIDSGERARNMANWYEGELVEITLTFKDVE